MVKCLSGVTFGTVLRAGVFEVSDEFFLFRVRGDDRIIVAQKISGFFVDKPEYFISLGVGLAILQVFLIHLLAVAEFLQCLGHGVLA